MTFLDKAGLALITLGFKGAYLAGVIFHLLLVLTVSCRDTFVALSKGTRFFQATSTARGEKLKA